MQTGFPQNRSSYLRRVIEKASDDLDDEEGDIEEQMVKATESAMEHITIPGVKGKFVDPPSIHEKYASRPKCIEHVSLAQFAISYVAVPKKWVGAKTTDKPSDFRIVCPCLAHACRTEYLPTVISLNDPKLGIMRLRTFPAILQRRKFKESEHAHEYFYSEALLYRHWRSEDELHPDSFDECLTLFNEPSPCNESITHVLYVKTHLFPEMNAVETARIMVEELSEHRPTHIGDQLDPQKEQEEQDQNLVGTEMDENQQIRSYSGVSGHGPADAEPCIYKKADFGNMDEMYHSARRLVPEQRLVFDRLIGYAKEMRKSLANGGKMPEPPLMTVLGGAGSGKSHLINTIWPWFEFFLTTDDNRRLNQPLVVKCAPTGMAAKKIGGLTLHSAFRLDFANSFTSMSEATRESFRNILSEVQLVIIDEVSMVKSDVLYQLNMRLQEIHQRPLEDFGKVAILLLGDLMQLKPVKGAWIFDRPKSEIYHESFEAGPLWGLFDPYILEMNHRQKNDREYADILNRIRYGEHTEDDITKLKNRVVQSFPENVPEEALMIFCKKDNVTRFNERKMGKLHGPLLSLRAKHIHPSFPDYKPTIQDDGSVGDTPFMDNLSLKTGARVMLVFNVDTSDSLTNGTCGTVVGNNKNTFKRGLPLFDIFHYL